MIRDIPSRGNEEIELYMRTYYSLLRSTSDIRVRSLEETHSAMNSSLHVGADDPTPDISAFVYSVMRLPQCLPQVDLVLMGQSDEVFDRRGFPDVEKWQPVTAHSRRRKMFFDGESTLAAFIASVSDIDDLIPMLTAYQIEWNKLHDAAGQHARCWPASRPTSPGGEPLAPEEVGDVADVLGISADDFVKLQAAWGPALWPNLLQAGRERKDMAIRLLAGSLTDYRRATDGWWYTDLPGGRSLPAQRPFLPAGLLCLVQYPQPGQPAGRLCPGHRGRVGGFLAGGQPGEPVASLPAPQGRPGAGRVYGEPALLRAGQVPAPRRRRDAGEQSKQPCTASTGSGDCCTSRIPSTWTWRPRSSNSSPCAPKALTGGSASTGLEALQESDAVIFNVDYPLGMAAYQIFSQVAANLGELQGVYFMGKAATLNGQVGDVMIPNVVYDEHSQNTFLFKNCFLRQRRRALSDPGQRV